MKGSSTLSGVRDVFSSSGFRRLFATRAVSQIGDGMFQLAAADLLLFDKPGPNPALTLTLLGIVTLIPFSAVSPFVGVFIDRWDRRKILELVPIARAALALLVGLGVGRKHQGADFYVIVLLILSANRLFLATISAVLPQFVEDDHLLVANSVALTGGSIANVVGLGIGAGLSAIMGGTRAAGVSAVAFALGALLARTMDVRRGSTPAKSGIGQELRDVLDEMGDGFRRLRGNARVSFALSAVIANQIAVGAMTGGVAVYYIHVLHLKVRSVGVVLGAIATGLAVGIVFVPALGRRVRHDRLIPASFAIAGLATAFSAATLSRPTIVAGASIVGLAYAMTKIPVDTIVQEEMPDSHRGRAFAIYDMLFNVARVGGTALSALAVAVAFSPRTIVLLITVAYVVFTVAFTARERTLFAAPRRSDAPVSQPGTREPSPAVSVGELVTVRSYSGHRADSEPRAIVVGGREIPVDAIEWQAVEERQEGVRRRVFVVRAAGSRIRLVTSEESSRWEVERIAPQISND